MTTRISPPAHPRTSITVLIPSHKLDNALKRLGWGPSPGFQDCGNRMLVRAYPDRSSPAYNMKIFNRTDLSPWSLAPALLAAMLAAPAAQGTSFNCKKARTSVEQQVCKDKTLSKKDETVEPLYQQSVKGLKGVAAKQARKNQESWLELRDACTSFEWPGLPVRQAHLRTEIALPTRAAIFDPPVAPTTWNERRTSGRHTCRPCLSGSNWRYRR